MKYPRLFVGGLVLLALVTIAFVDKLFARQGRLSAVVAFVSEEPAITQFLKQPGEGYMQGYMRFGPDMPDDVIIAVDQEFIDGVTNPLFVKGGDWMAFVGVQRAGKVWVAAGTEETLTGKPSSDRNWNILDLNTRLQPDVWYRLRVVADFRMRHFKSFTIEGPDINKTFDLSEYPLDYPNYLSFNGRAMTYYVAAMRMRDMMKVAGNPIVNFDDAEAGIITPDGNSQRVFFNGFEDMDVVSAQPFDLVSAQPFTGGLVIDLKPYQQGRWYLERNESIFRIEKVPFAHSDSGVGVADANLD